MRSAVCLAALALFAVPVLPAAAAPAKAAKASPQTRLSPCKLPADGPGAPEMDALCGTFEAWENRQTGSRSGAGRKIGLKVVVLPATGPKRQPEPVFLLAGGPGEAAAGLAGFLGTIYQEVRRERDLVFVDVRGSADPGRLTCDPSAGTGDLQAYLGDFFPIDNVRRCRAELEKNHDLTQYTTDNTVDDLDEIRAWLGYGKVNVDGGSYGTRVALSWLRRHPASLRAVVLSGVAPMSEASPLSHSAMGQRSMDMLLGWCEKEEACHKAFPNVRAELAAVLERAGREPLEVEVQHPETGRPVKIRVGRDALGDGIRFLLYRPDESAALPMQIHEASQGNVRPLVEAAVQTRYNINQGLAMGLLFSVTCAEDIPFIDPAEIPARTAGSFLGDGRVRSQMAACTVWPHAKVPPEHKQEVRSDLPVLLISGERDPVTPPEFARRAATHLTNNLQVVVPFEAHSGFGPCVMKIRTEFFSKGTTRGIDTTCLAKAERLPFVVEAKKE